MKPVLVIPTYSRPDGLAIERCKNLPFIRCLAIRKEQLSLYDKWSDYYQFILLKNVEDIGETRAKIVKWANYQGYDWMFMFDDDIRKVETLVKTKDGNYNSKRILEGAQTLPRFEIKALRNWFETAKEYNLSMSSPNHRAYDRSYHGTLRINNTAVIQCLLLHIPDIVSVGNFLSLRKYGNEDYLLQYKLMKAGYLCGKVGTVEYDVNDVGSGEGGCNAVENPDIVKRYESYIKAFQQNIDNTSLMKTKLTKQGIPSLQFNWKEWGNIVEQQTINIGE